MGAIRESAEIPPAFTELLAFVQACQVVVGAWSHNDDALSKFRWLWTCLSAVPSTSRDSERVVVSEAVTRVAVGALYGRDPGPTDANAVCETPTRQRVRELIRVVDKSFSDPAITLTNCASLLRVSYCYLSRAFSSEVGHHFTVHLNGVRMLNAALLLRCSAQSVKEIGINVGYLRTSELDRHFQEWVGMTPGQFRTARRGRAVDATTRDFVTQALGANPSRSPAELSDVLGLDFGDVTAVARTIQSVAGT